MFLSYGLQKTIKERTIQNVCINVCSYSCHWNKAIGKVWKNKMIPALIFLQQSPKHVEPSIFTSRFMFQDINLQQSGCILLAVLINFAHSAILSMVPCFSLYIPVFSTTPNQRKLSED